MFSRRIGLAEVKEVIQEGEVIRTYDEDKPYPSYLLSKVVAGKALHAVIARNPADDSCVLITAYEPDVKIWGEDFKTKR